MDPISQRGFGVLDGLIILAILMVGVAVLIPYTVSEKQDLSIQKCVKNLREIDKSMRLWQLDNACLLYTSPSPRDRQKSRMPSSA